MELACTAFQDVVRCLFTSEIDIVATVHVKSDPFTDALKRRADIELVQVNRANRDALPEDLAARFDSPGRPSPGRVASGPGPHGQEGLGAQGLIRGQALVRASE
ncbi:nucleoside-triphosphatase [Streptomyces platensis]|uniref:nucleoside-triphosphatase n=1 Tax=Streptomyces platensis TaxID=58346 RepID=UPI002ED0FC9D|nr:nucleoside-triphosphatase [Streptomyces platensis]